MSMIDAVGIPALSGSPLLHFSKKLEVLVWPLKKVADH